MTKLKALLTLDEAATDLAVSKTTLRRWTNDGRLPRSRRDQSKWPWSGQILPVSLSTGSLSNARRSSSKPPVPDLAIGFTPLPITHLPNPAWCSMTPAPGPSRSKSGRWRRGSSVVRGPDSGAFGHRHPDPRQRTYGQRLSLRDIRDTWGERPHRVRRLAGLARPLIRRKKFQQRTSPTQSGTIRPPRQPADANPDAEDSGSTPLPAYGVSKFAFGDAILQQCLCNFIKTGIFRLLLGGWLVV